ncbi:hypothetical protein EDC22_11025 [Tepidamorphus gemmatus]|uniref:Uncharacterized protein n=1 Tax=Tepidamorphus gemmatus TaxID=747076 RepID=A0A4V6NZL5_9HYPH|nr:hypothetical protein EDC22_11025 [Tepidamorphus gemmatus]
MRQRDRPISSSIRSSSRLSSCSARRMRENRRTRSNADLAAVISASPTRGAGLSVGRSSAVIPRSLTGLPATGATRNQRPRHRMASGVGSRHVRDTSRACRRPRRRFRSYRENFRRPAVAPGAGDAFRCRDRSGPVRHGDGERDPPAGRGDPRHGLIRSVCLEVRAAADRRPDDGARAASATGTAAAVTSRMRMSCNCGSKRYIANGSQLRAG